MTLGLPILTFTPPGKIDRILRCCETGHVLLTDEEFDACQHGICVPREQQ